MKPVRYVASLALMFACTASISGAQSLGDVARQEKSRKSASPAAKRVVTNDDITSSAEPKPAAPAAHNAAKPADYKPSTAESRNAVAAELKVKIKQQKVKVNVLELQVKQLQQRLDRWKTSDCTYTYHPENPYGNACDVPQKLTAAYDQAKAELQQAHSALEQMQDKARRLGFGVQVYDPD